jgi:hypothetical protein
MREQMNTRLRAAALRAGAATVLAVGLVAIAGPAYAADGPDVAVTPISLHIAKGVKQAKAKPFQVELLNRGNAAASDVTVKVELANLADGIGFVRPDGCQKAGKATYTCVIGDIPAGQDVVLGIPLFSTKAKVGPAGYFTVTANVAGDTNTEDNTVDADIKVDKKGYDLTVWAQDVYAEVVADGDEVGEETKTPVPPGSTAPLDSAIFNHGSKRVVGLTYSVEVPEGVLIASAPADCFPLENTDGAVIGVTCEDDEVVLKPGEVLLPKITVKVGDSVEPGSFKGIVSADALRPGAGDAEETGDQARIATKGQRKQLEDVDPIDNSARFDVIVGAAPSGEPTTPAPVDPTTPVPGEPGAGAGGGLPRTGPPTALIAGVGVAVLAAGVVLLLGMRRRRRFVAE